MGQPVTVVYDQRPTVADAVGTLAATLRSQHALQDAQNRAQQESVDARTAATQKQGDSQAQARAKSAWDAIQMLANSRKGTPRAITDDQVATYVNNVRQSDPEAAKWMAQMPKIDLTETQKTLDDAALNRAHAQDTSTRQVRTEAEGGAPAPALALPLSNEKWPEFSAENLSKPQMFDNMTGSATPAGLPSAPSTPAPPLTAAAPTPPSPSAPLPSTPPVSSSALPSAPAPPPAIVPPTPSVPSAAASSTPPDPSIASPSTPSDQSAAATPPPLPGAGLAATIRGAGMGSGVGVPPSLVTAESMVGQQPSEANRGPGSVPAGFNPAQQAVARQTLGVDPTGSQQVTEQGAAQTRTETARKNRVDETRLAGTAASENALRGAQTAKARQEVADAKAATTAASGTDGQLDAFAKALAARTLDPALLRNSIYMKNAAAGDALMQKVHQIDPNFNMQDYPQYLAVKKSFTSGPDARTKVALNQLVGHAKTLVDAFDSLHNTSSPMVNAPLNFMADTIGGTDSNKKVQKSLGSVDQAVGLVAKEAAKAFQGSGVPAEGEIKAFRDTVNHNQSPDKFAGSMGTLFELLDTAIAQQETKYREGVGQSDFHVLEPTTAKTLNDLKKRLTDASSAPVAPTPAPPPAVAVPKIGDTKKAGNGATIQFNGHGWVVVGNP